MGNCASRPDAARTATTQYAMLQASWRRIHDGTPAFDLWLASFKHKLAASSEDSKIHGSYTTGPLTYFNDSFFKRFFELVPTAAEQFAKQIHHQARLLGYFMQQLIGSKQAPDAIPGVAHAHFNSVLGLQSIHYAPVGDSILYAVKTCLGDEYTPSVAAAWTVAVARMVSVLRPAARTAEQRLMWAQYRKAGLSSIGCTGAAAAVAVAPSSTALPHVQSLRLLRSTSRASFVTEDNSRSPTDVGAGDSFGQRGLMRTVSGNRGMDRTLSRQSFAADPVLYQSGSLSPRAQDRAWQDRRSSVVAADRVSPGPSAGQLGTSPLGPSPVGPSPGQLGPSPLGTGMGGSGTLRAKRLNSIDGSVMTEHGPLRRSRTKGGRGSLPGWPVDSPKIIRVPSPSPTPTTDMAAVPLDSPVASPADQTGVRFMRGRSDSPGPSVRQAWGAGPGVVTSDNVPGSYDNFKPHRTKRGSPGPLAPAPAQLPVGTSGSLPRDMSLDLTCEVTAEVTAQVEEAPTLVTFAEAAEAAPGLVTVPEDHEGEKRGSALFG